jgi:hypothetical protein
VRWGLFSKYIDLLVTPLTFVIEWYVICDEISIFVIGAK